jgi:hypothetical protein
MEYQAWCGKTTTNEPLSPLATEANPGLAEGCEGWQSFSSHSMVIQWSFALTSFVRHSIVIQ